MASDLGSVAVLLRSIAKVINANNKRIQLVALKDFEGRYKQRIFNKGLGSNGRNIGKYSTKDILIGKTSFPIRSVGQKLFAANKKLKKDDDNKFKWVTLKGRRLAVLPGGYKKIRELSGRQTSKVDLEFTSDLRNGIQIGNNGNDLVFGFIEDLQRLKAEGNEGRFNKPIFSASKSEEKGVEKAVVREIDKLISKLI
jgi:hypothetical protein